MNATANYEFTILVPVYNEEECLERVGQRMKEYLPTCLRKACVLFVDDGSKDGSLAMMKEICAANDDFYYISSRRNGGLSSALKMGFDHCESPLVGYIDADLQTSPEDFNLLLADIDSYTMVTGIRAKRKDTWFKKMQSKIANAYRRMMTGDGALDTGCPLKVLHTDAAKKIPMVKGMHRFLIALVLLQDGGCYKQMPVSCHPRIAGTSKYHLWNRLWGPFIDCFAYRYIRKRYIKYIPGESNLNAPKA